MYIALKWSCSCKNNWLICRLIANICLPIWKCLCWFHLSLSICIIWTKNKKLINTKATLTGDWIIVFYSFDIYLKVFFFVKNLCWNYYWFNKNFNRSIYICTENRMIWNFFWNKRRNKIFCLLRFLFLSLCLHVTQKC